jgi:hypothetical protein
MTPNEKEVLIAILSIPLAAVVGALIGMVIGW